MAKIAFIGAGSFTFTRDLVRDILSYPAFSDATIALMDINEERLSYIKKAIDNIVESGKYSARVVATMDRIEALKGADGVVTTILTGDVEVWRHDLEIPARYGVNFQIGDTRGPSGIFRALRTIPIMFDICKDIERYCPNAVLLNYSNPMAMLCRAMQGYTKVNITGLCHSVQLTAEMLAKWIGIPLNEITYLCAGINHQAWYLEFKWNGCDAYPLIKEAARRPENYEAEKVRNEMLFHLDYYVTESSTHNSEYNPWFRKRRDLMEKYCNYKSGKAMMDRIKWYTERKTEYSNIIQKWIKEPVDLKRGHEYAACIFNALFGDGTMYEFNGNVRNFGLIDNLRTGCCVEVPILASKRGLSPMHVGSLPEHLAILNDVNARCEELAVEGAVHSDPRAIFHAVCMDPLTSSILSLDEIQKMVDEMFEINKEWLPQFKHLR